MAKKKAAATKTSNGEYGSKSAMIKELIAAGKSNKEIHTELAGKGIKISPNYVSVIKSGMGLAKKRKKKRGPKAGKVAASNGRANSGTIIGNDLVVAISFCKSVGGIGQAKKLIETLEEIKGL